MFDFELWEDTSSKTHLKEIAIEVCIGMIAKTISQSEFRVRKEKKTVKDEMYWRLNVRPNRNQTAAFFWQTVIRKLIYENECLIIQTDTEDLLTADSFSHNEYAVLEDTFHNVVCQGYEFKRSFKMQDVIYMKYSNEKLANLMDKLFEDYGKLFARLVEYQMLKSQIRSTVDIEQNSGKDEEATSKLQRYVDRVYQAIRNKAVAIIPQQKGYKYDEHQQNSTSGQGVDELNKLTDGFLFQFANALGIPNAMVKGDMADASEQTKNYMVFCIDPIVKILSDALNFSMVDKDKYLRGEKLEIRTVSYHDIFDIATAIDKLFQTGWSGNELRDKVGDELSDDPRMDKHFITKNYSDLDSTEGSENDET